MARISVVGTPFEKALLNDIDKKQSLREHTINPPGQERYIRPVDTNALSELLASYGGSNVAAELAAFLAATVGAANDISIATIKTQADAMTGIAGTTDDEAEAIQDILSYRLVETGSVLLSFDNGVIKGMLDKGWIKVFNEAGGALFTL